MSVLVGDSELDRQSVYICSIKNREDRSVLPLQYNRIVVCLVRVETAGQAWHFPLTLMPRRRELQAHEMVSMDSTISLTLRTSFSSPNLPDPHLFLTSRLQYRIISILSRSA